MAYQPALEKITGFDINWNIVAYPDLAWAKQVFPDDADDVAVAKLADAIFAASRVDVEDPIGNWTAHNAALRSRTEWLNGHNFHALHFTGPGTDLTVGLADGHEWMGGASTAKNGITCNPNIPTEEVFTTPHARRVSGHVSSTKPLSYQGTLIDEISVRFEEGRIVEAKASKGEDVLKKVLDTDEGARRLGEVALVPHSSPISASGLLFFNTLFDENAACHIALGQCYSKCFVDGASLSQDEIAAARRQQEFHPYRLDDRLGQDRHRRRRQGRRPRAGHAQGRVGLRGQPVGGLRWPSILRSSASTRRPRPATGSGCWSTASGRAVSARRTPRSKLWLKDIAPSDELRKWFGHEPERWAEFQERYRVELDGNGEVVEQLRALLSKGRVTLLFGAHDEAHNNAVALAGYLLRHPRA